MDFCQLATTTTKNNLNVDSLESQEISTRSTQSEIAQINPQERNPLSFELILEKTFHYLDVNSIKLSRLVSKLWSVEGAKVLITKCYVHIPSDVRVEGSANEMDQFKIFLSYKSNEVSMIPNIAVDTVDDVELWKSFKVLGKQVNSLKLSIVDDKAELLHNLLELLPNLKYLSIYDVLYCPKIGDIFKVLTSVMSKPEKDRNSLVISFMSLRPDNLTQLEDLEKLADCINIKIVELVLGIEPCFFIGVPNYEIRIASIFSRLLSTSQNVLQQLTLHCCDRYLSLLEFPDMPALTHLKLKFSREARRLLNHCRFSSSFQFSHSAPNLYSIVIETAGVGRGLGSYFFVNLFNSTGTALSVKRLEYWDDLNDCTINRLFQIFPNLQDFEVRRPDCSRKMFQSLFNHGENLKKLDITIDLDLYYEDCPALDSFFTGFPPWTVYLLRNFPKLTHRFVRNLERLRVNPSILNLKELEVLTIHFEGFESKIPKRMLAFAGENAFKLLPKDSKIIIDLQYLYSPRKRSIDAFGEVSKLLNVIIR